MKKTLVLGMVTVLGLAMSASALPPVELDGSCAYVDTLTTEYVGFMEVIDSGLDATQTDFESVGIVGDDVVFNAGLPDVLKLSLLGAAMCADSALADDYTANYNQFLDDFVADLDALAAYGSDAQAAILAGGTAVATMFPGGADPADLMAFMAGISVPAELQPLIYAMCTDVTMTVTIPGTDFPAYLPALCVGIAEILEEDVATGDDSVYGYAMGLRWLYGNALTGILSVSTTSQYTLTAFMDAALFGDFRDYSDMFAQLDQVFQVVAGYAQTLSLPEAAPLATAAGTFATGKALIDAIALPALPILGVTVKAPEDEPFGNQGDYDGDGVSNLDTYNGLVGAGAGTAEDFVEAASGANPWYPGNPLMPAAGLVGLAALVGVFAAGGAFILRKK